MGSTEMPNPQTKASGPLTEGRRVYGAQVIYDMTKFIQQSVDKYLQVAHVPVDALDPKALTQACRRRPSKRRILAPEGT